MDEPEDGMVHNNSPSKIQSELTRNVLELRKKYLHTTDSGQVRENLTTLCSSYGHLEHFFNSSTLNPLKDLARVHGLPHTFQKLLERVLKDGHPDVKLQLKLALILKYCVHHDPDFMPIQFLLITLFRYTIDDVATTDDFFIREFVTQLLLTITMILNPRRVAAESLDENTLRSLQDYLPHVRGKHRSTVKACLQRMGYVSNSTGAMTSNWGRTSGGIRSGEEVIRSFHRKVATKISAHAVKTQQTQAVTTEENISEKTQMQNVNLANALQMNRCRSAAAIGKGYGEHINPARSIDGSDQCWWKTTAWEITNFLEKAKAGGVVSRNDVGYLQNKFKVGAFKISFSQKSQTMVSMIAEIFLLISKYQELTDSTVELLLRQAMDHRREDATYDSVRIHILRVAENHCKMRKLVPNEIQKTLIAFEKKSFCTKEMNKIIWGIRAKDDNLLESNFAGALDRITSAETCDEALAYIDLQVSKEQRCKVLKTFDFIPRILLIITAGDGITVRPKSRLKAVEILEGYLAYDWTDGLDINIIEQLIASTTAQCSEDLNLAIVRCILRSIGKKHNELQYLQRIPQPTIAFLANLYSESTDIKLQIFLLAILQKLMDHPEIRTRVAPIIHGLEFSPENFLRKDIIYHHTGQVILEEDLPENFYFGDPDLDGHSDFICVSAIKAKLLVSAFPFMPSASMNEGKVSAVSQCLESSPDKMTRIYCSEYLFQVADAGGVFSTTILSSIQGFAFDPVADVHVYSTAAYCTSLANQISDLPVDHVNFLPNLYSLKRVFLGTDDFSPWVNPKILHVFYTASKFTRLSDQVLQLLTLILNTTCEDESVESEGHKVIVKILSTLRNVCDKEGQPEALQCATVDAVERLFTQSELFNEDCSRILEKCILAGRFVSDSVLEKFDNGLMFSEVKSVSFVKRLYMANENQELPDDTFHSLQMELMGLRLHPEAIPGGHSFLKARHLDDGIPSELLNCFKKYLRTGKSLTPLCMKSLQFLLNRDIEFDAVLSCLTLCTSNGQRLPKELVHSALMKPSSTPIHYQLAVALIQRNQQLPPEFTQRIFSHVKVQREILESDGGQTLNFLTALIQQNSTLPLDVINIYCNHVSTLAQDARLTVEVLSALTRLLETGALSHPALLMVSKKALLASVLSCNDNITVQELGLKGLSYLSPYNILLESERQKLVQLAHTFDPEARDQLLKLVAGGDTEDMWSPTENPEGTHTATVTQFIQKCLDRIRRGDKSVKMSRLWRERLKTAFSHDPAAIKSAQENLVRPCGHLLSLSEFESHLIECVCFAMINTGSEEVKTECKLLIETVTELGGVLSTESVKYLSFLQDTPHRDWSVKIREWDSSQNLFHCLEAWTLQPTKHALRILLGAFLSDPALSRAHYGSIIKRLKRVCIKEWNYVPNIAIPISFYMLHIHTDADPSPEMIEILEMEISRTRDGLNWPVLHAYFHLLLKMKGRRSENRIKCLENLAEYIEMKKGAIPWNEIMLIFNVFTAVGSTDDLPRTVLDVAMKGVQSGNPTLRGPSFLLIMMTRNRENHLSNIFSSLLKQAYEKIHGRRQTMEVEESEFNLQLALTLNMLTFWDVKSLKNVPQDQWISHLMMTDFIESFARTVDEKLELHPIVAKLCSDCSVLEYRHVTDCLLEFRYKYPGASMPKILKLLMSVSEMKEHIFTLSDTNWIPQIIDRGLSLKLKRKLRDVSLPVAEMTIRLQTTLEFGVLDDLIEFIPEGCRLEDFQNLLSFLNNNLDAIPLLRDTFVELKDLKYNEMPEFLQHVQIKLLMSVGSMTVSRHAQLKEDVKELLRRGYDFQKVSNLFTAVMEQKAQFQLRTNCSSGTEILASVLLQLRQYDVSPRIFAIVEEKLRRVKDISQWLPSSSQIIMERVFSGTQGLKTPEQIWQDLNKLNRIDIIRDLQHISYDFPSEVNIIVNGILQSVFGHIKRKIRDWNKAEIQTWAKEIRRRPDDHQWKSQNHFLMEALSVIKRAYELETGYHLTSIQILSCLTTLHSSKKGLLLQVATGSGKSTIIAVISVIKALRGEKVDVFTSSPVLAERDSKEWTSFYSYFHLTCDYNGDRGSNYIRGEKSCYRADILYGDTSQFQFDTLRDEYSGLRTRAGRMYGFAIVDEVDSMFIDDSSKLARLTSTLPGMDLLQILYHLTWHRLHDIQQRLLLLEGHMFYLEGRLWQENGVYRLDYIPQDGAGTILSIPNVTLFIAENIKIPDALARSKIFPVAELESFVADHLKTYLNTLIGDQDFNDTGFKTDKIALPKALLNFARSQINNWVHAALTAVTFQENVHYVVDDGQIKPVDFLTTGIVQSSTNWNNGLHQFLQIKHCLKVTTETVTTNFLSNMAMFKKYSGNLVGFTGTLGSTDSQKVLEHVYDVKTAIIPDLYYKRFSRLRDIIVSDQSEWLAQIVRTTLLEANSNRRGVLIICQTIKEAELVAEELNKSSSPVAIKLYVRNGANQERQVERIHPGDIIVATNLAGRGTDIKTADVESNGGLHVILTFLPESLRVEEQAFGRTARQGNKGTGQLIVFSTAEKNNLDTLRNEEERLRLQQFVDTQLHIVETKDKLFQRFCKFYREKRDFLRRNPVDPNPLGLTPLLNSMDYETLTVLELTILQAIEERWAIFLKRIDDGVYKVAHAEEAYNAFERKLEKSFKEGTSISGAKNCFYCVQYGNELYRKDSKFNSKVVEARTWFDLAVDVDPEFAAAAYAGKAYTLLKGNTRAVGSTLYEPNYKMEAIKLLNRAIKLLSEEMGIHYTTAQTLIQHRTQRMDSDLFHQLNSKMSLIGRYVRSLEATVAAVEKSLRKVDWTEVKDGMKTTVELLTNRSYPKETGSTAYQLDFHDLTVRQDCGARDQAVDTINKVKSRLMGDLDVVTRASKTISLEVRNEDLSKLFAIQNSWSAVVKLEDVSDWSRIESMLEEFRSLQLTMSGTVEDMDNFLKSQGAEGRKFTLSYDDLHDSSSGYQRHCSKQVASAQSLSAQIPCGLQTIFLTTTLYKSMKLEPLKESTPKNCHLSVTLTDINQTKITDLWKEIFKEFGGNSITFTKLNALDAISMVNKLRKLELKSNFILRFDGLNYADALFMLENADRKQEDMTQSDLKELREEFSSQCFLWEELHEVGQRGILIVAYFNEMSFIPWRGVIAVGILATVQVAAGAALIWTGFGATLGMGLITEGMADYVYAGLAYSGRNFSLSTYAKQKAVSLTISAVSMGWGALKDGAKGGSLLFSGVTTEAVEQAGTLAITSGKSLTQTVATTSRKLSSLAFKQVAVQGLETAGRVGLNAMVDSVVRFTFDQVRDDILSEVERAIFAKFGTDEFLEVLSTFAAVDATIRRKQLLEIKMKSWVNEMTNPESGEWSQLWETVGIPLCRGILSDSRYLGSVFSMVTRATMIIRAMKEIATAVGNVCNKIMRKLETENQRITSTAIISHHFSLTSEEANTIIQMMEFSDESCFLVRKFPSDTSIWDDQKKVGPVELQRLFQNLHSIKSNFLLRSEQMSPVIKAVAEGLTTHIIRVSDRQLASPMTTLTVGKIVSEISSQIQSRFVLSADDMSEDQRRAQELRMRPQETLSEDERHFLQVYSQPHTIADQIHGNSKDFTLAYQQRDIITRARVLANQVSNGQLEVKLTPRVETALKNIVYEGPADLSTVFLLSQKNGLKVKIVDDPKYVPTPKEKDDGYRIIVYQKRDGGTSVGHYMLQDPRTGDFCDFAQTSPSSTDCAYLVLSELTHQSPEQLRSQAAGLILDNMEGFDRIQKSAEWVRNRFPEKADGLLFVGGGPSTVQNVNANKSATDWEIKCSPTFPFVETLYKVRDEEEDTRTQEEVVHAPPRGESAAEGDSQSNGTWLNSSTLRGAARAVVEAAITVVTKTTRQHEGGNSTTGEVPAGANVAREAASALERQTFGNENARLTIAPDMLNATETLADLGADTCEAESVNDNENSYSRFEDSVNR